MDSRTSVIRESQKPEDTMDKVGRACAQKTLTVGLPHGPEREDISMMCPGELGELPAISNWSVLVLPRPIGVNWSQLSDRKSREAESMT